MEIVYFIGAIILLIALIYGTLSWRYRDKRQDRKTDQIVRDRYEHDRT
jgi:heme/copper-type cytochrome/quinol oxidase subunit 2